MKYLLIGVLIGVAFLFGYYYSKYLNGMQTDIVILEKSIKINSGTFEGTLPKGTVLFFEESMSEGFEVYKMYINVNSGFLKKKRSEKNWYKAPVWIVSE